MKLENKIFNITDDKNFEELALEIFKFQYENNFIYKKYVDYLNININSINSIEKIPFLPIEFFKSQRVITKYSDLEDKKFTIFKSSGTTGMQRSKHYIYDISLYEKSFLNGFNRFFGSPEQYTIIALLPSYLEAGESSLVYMVNKLIELSKNKESGFFLHELQDLQNKVIELDKSGKKIMLWGVTYALLDLAEITNYSFKNLIIVETGGMKGRRKEITREELHTILKNKFGVSQIYSEYGMTELLSQAYSTNDSYFEPSDTMRIMIRDINDPFSFLPEGKTGGINIIDLANLYSCSFIETKDLGRIVFDRFEVLGRFDNSDIRGCNLLVI